MSPLEQLRANQHNDVITDADVDQFDFLTSRHLDDVTPDLTVHMSQDEQHRLELLRWRAS